MSVLNEFFQTVVKEYIPAKWQPTAIQVLGPLVDKYGTPDKITQAVKVFASWIVGTENLVAAYKASLPDKSEDQLNSDADAAIEAQISMVNENHAANEDARLWFINAATVSAAVALQVI